MERRESPRQMYEFLDQYELCFQKRGIRCFLRLIVNGKPRLFRANSNSDYNSSKVRAMRMATNHLRSPPTIDTEDEVTPYEDEEEHDGAPNIRTSQPTSEDLYASSPELLIIEDTPSPPPIPMLPGRFLKASELPAPPRRKLSHLSRSKPPEPPAPNIPTPAPVTGHFVHPSRRHPPTRTPAANIPSTRGSLISKQVKGHRIHPSRLALQKPACNRDAPNMRPANFDRHDERNRTFVRSMFEMVRAERNNSDELIQKVKQKVISELRNIYIQTVGEKEARARMASGFSPAPFPAPARRERTNHNQTRPYRNNSSLLPIARQRKPKMPKYNPAPHKRNPLSQRNAMNNYQRKQSHPPNDDNNNSGYFARYHDLGTQDPDATHIRESSPLLELPNLAHLNPKTQSQKQNPRSRYNQKQNDLRYIQVPSAHARAGAGPSRAGGERNNTPLPIPPPASPPHRAGAHQQHQRHTKIRQRSEPPNMQKASSSQARSEATSTTVSTARGTKRSATSGRTEDPSIVIGIAEPKTKKRRKKSDEPKFDSCGVLLEGKVKYQVESDVDYISKCQVAVQRQPDEFIGLMFEAASAKKSHPSLHGVKATVYTQNAEGEKDKKLRCRKHAKTKKAAKHAAAGGLLRKMLAHYPELSYEGAAKGNKEANGEDVNSNGNGPKGNNNSKEEVTELNMIQLMMDLQAKDIIQKQADYESVLKDQWEATCTVFVEGIDKSNNSKKKKISIPYSAEAKHRKKNLAIRMAAKKVLDKLIDGGIEGCKEVLHARMFPKSKDTKTKNENVNQGCNDDGSDDDEYENLDVDLVYDDEEYTDGEGAGKKLSGWLDNIGKEFRVPEGYAITVARSGRECKDFIEDHEEEKIGVYMESPDVYKSVIYGLHYFEGGDNHGNLDIPMAHGECKVIALAVESGALLLVEPAFAAEEEWPPTSLVNLFRSTHGELCGYKLNSGEHALGFTPDYRHCISDIQTVANGLKNERDIRQVIHLPLVDILRKWTGKELTANIDIDLDDGDVDDGGIVDERRLKTAVYTAAAVLAAYHSMCIERDAKIRNQVGTCAMKGFTDLMNVLGGRKQLFPIR